MTTNELKQYINKVLGNNIRCLLPSYWWKRLFGLVVDKVAEVDGKVAEVPTKQYIDNAVKGKQDTLVSGTNIKTINGESVLGEGDIDITSKSFLTLQYRPDEEGIRIQNEQIWLKLISYPQKAETLPPIRIEDNYMGVEVYPHNYYVTYYDDVYAFGFIATISDTTTLQSVTMRYLLTGNGEIIKTTYTNQYEYPTIYHRYSYTSAIKQINQRVYQQLLSELSDNLMFSAVRLQDADTGMIVYPHNIFKEGDSTSGYNFVFIGTITTPSYPNSDVILSYKVKYILKSDGTIDRIKLDVNPESISILNIGSITPELENSNVTIFENGKTINMNKDKVHYYSDSDTEYVECVALSAFNRTLPVTSLEKTPCYIFSVSHNENLEQWYVDKASGIVGRYPMVEDIDAAPDIIKFNSHPASKQLRVTITPENALEKDIIFTSTDENVATVDDTGLITTVGPGTCDIYVSSVRYPHIKSGCSVAVADNTTE